MPNALNANQQTTLNTASDNAVKDYFSDLDRYFRDGRWIGLKNRYRENTTRRLEKDIVATPSLLNSKHLGEYIAASTVLHCFDGWSFLSKAVNAHANGDRYAAHHLAYYAELRATMSLLACEGIGVFNKKHLVIDAGKNCVVMDGKIGTHEFCWLALEHWAKQKRSSDLLMQIITPGGLPLQDWLDEFGVAPTSTSIGQDWLTSWGMDLRNISQDHDGRNEVSYRPNFIKPVNSIEPIKASEFCRNIWELFEPAYYSRFEHLDRHLLRITLRRSFKAVMGYYRPSGYRKRIETTLNKIAPKGLPPQVWKSFLLDNEIPPLISEASGVIFNRGSFHMPVIARAVLLLRIATGATSRLLKSLGYDSKDLQFWWAEYGESLGLWKPPLRVDFIELWADVEASLIELSEWETDHTGHSNSIFEWNQDKAKELDNLCACERIGLWGLGI